MTTETLISPGFKTAENKINYLWLNGERVIGIQGLEIFEDCEQLQHMPGIREEQRDALNRIINASLEKYAEEGICNYWPSLIATTKKYFSEQGYCVVKKDEVAVDLRQRVNLSQYFVEKQGMIKNNASPLTVADLWNIHRQRKVRLQRRYI